MPADNVRSLRRGLWMDPTRRLYSLDDIRRAARWRLPKLIFDYVDSGTEDDVSLRRNTEAYADIMFRPRVMVDVSKRNLSTTVLGEPVELPVIFAPAGLQGLLHPQGELAGVRAAGEFGIVYGLSSGPSYSMEEVAHAASAPLWFQLYLWGDRNYCEAMLSRAANAGYSALCLTVDVAVVGTREKNHRNGLTLPIQLRPRNTMQVLRRPWWLRTAYHSLYRHKGNFADDPNKAGTIATAMNVQFMMNAAATWEEVTWLKSVWKGPLIVKGLMTGEDARRAADAGADAVVISNHGGRQLDGTAAPIQALPEVVEAVGDQLEVFIDGGIRRGTDIVKALALGARACLIGKPYVFSLALGPNGPRRILEILRHEIDTTLALLGVPSVLDLDPSCVEMPSVWSKTSATRQV